MEYPIVVFSEGWYIEGLMVFARRMVAIVGQHVVVRPMEWLTGGIGCQVALRQLVARRWWLEWVECRCGVRYTDHRACAHQFVEPTAHREVRLRLEVPR